MKSTEHLWAVGYDDMERANHVREEIVRLGWLENRLLLEDVAVVVRHLDGSFTINRERFPAASNIVGWSAVGFPRGSGARRAGGRHDDRRAGRRGWHGHESDVGRDRRGLHHPGAALMKPGTSALFVLDSAETWTSSCTEFAVSVGRS